MTQPTFYRAIQWGAPVAVRPELNETKPAHADMLRYDLAFCHPDEPSMVVVCIGFDAMRIAIGGKPENFSTRDVIRWLRLMTKESK